MNVKYDITTNQKLITLEKQLIFSWGKTLRNLIPNINNIISLFNKTVKNIISNFIPRETVKFDDRDPPWINKNAKQLILEKKGIYKRCVKANKDSELFVKVECLQNELNSIIEGNKQKYYFGLSNNSVDPKTSTKSHWSTLNGFVNNNKMPCLSPLSHQNKYVTDFEEKVKTFNSFFAEQCSLIKSKSLSLQYRLVAMILLKSGEDIDLRAKVIQETKNSVCYSKLAEPTGGFVLQKKALKDYFKSYVKIFVW